MQSTAVIMKDALYRCDARSGSCRRDHFAKTYTDERGHNLERKELDKLKDSAQTLCLGSALIVTVTFGATFALPGGYRADDHANGGTPTLAGRYAFDAFMIANALAFICSTVGTVSLLYSGLPMVDLKSRKVYMGTASCFVVSSLTSLAAAFALGVYMVLAPITPLTAVALHDESFGSDSHKHGILSEIGCYFTTSMQ